MNNQLKRKLYHAAERLPLGTVDEDGLEHLRMLGDGSFECEQYIEMLMEEFFDICYTVQPDEKQLRDFK